MYANSHTYILSIVWTKGGQFRIIHFSKIILPKKLCLLHAENIKRGRLLVDIITMSPRVAHLPAAGTAFAIYFTFPLLQALQALQVLQVLQVLPTHTHKHAPHPPTPDTSSQHFYNPPRFLSSMQDYAIRLKDDKQA